MLLAIQSLVLSMMTLPIVYGCPIVGGCDYPVGDHNQMPTMSLPNPNGYAITSGFFSPSDPNHAGIDLSNGYVGGEVRSIADGRVVEERTTNTGFGWALRIEHPLVTGGVVYSIYGHLLEHSVTVSIGDNVTRGQHIGQVDNTGRSYGNHLHFALRTVNDFGCGNVPSALSQCASDTQSNYSDPITFVSNQPQAQYITFVEGNPGVPGDGKYVSGANPFIGVELSSPYGLGQVTNGLTISVFSPAQNLLGAALTIENAQPPGSTCYIEFGVGPSLAGTVTRNGVVGVVEVLTQGDIDNQVSFANQVKQKSCAAISRNELNITHIYLSSTSHQPIGPIDAVAIGLGLNALP